MKPFKFLQSLLPNFSKTNVLDDVRMTRLDVTDSTLPSYENALRIFNGRKSGSPELQNDYAIFSRMVKIGSVPNTIVGIEKCLKPMLGTLDLVERLIESSYDEEIAGGGISYYKASVLQMLESIRFASKYARKYLNYALIVETAYIEDQAGVEVANKVDEAITPAEMRYLKDNFVQFCSVLASVAKPTSAIKTMFERIPDIAITEQNSKTLNSTVGEAKLDPFQHGFVPTWMNPIYHIRMRIAEWQVDTHNAAKEERKLLELRKLRLEQASAGKKSPGLEKEINYIQGRIDDLEARIREEETRYA